MTRTAKPFNLDQQIYTIYLQVGRRGHRAGWYAPERADEDMTRAATIRDIRTGQVEDVAAVICSNPAEGWCQDVSEDLAVEIANGLEPGEPISPELRDFLECHAGLDYVRGLRVLDPSFAA